MKIYANVYVQYWDPKVVCFTEFFLITFLLIVFIDLKILFPQLKYRQ